MSEQTTETFSDWDVACILAQALQFAMPHVPEYTGQGEFARDDIELALEEFDALEKRRRPQSDPAETERIDAEVRLLLAKDQMGTCARCSEPRGDLCPKCAGECTDTAR